MTNIEKVAEAIWRADPFRMGDPDTWTGNGDQVAYRRMAEAAIDALDAARSAHMPTDEPGWIA